MHWRENELMSPMLIASERDKANSSGEKEEGSRKEEGIVMVRKQPTTSG